MYGLKEYYTEEIKNTPSNEKRLDKLNKKIFKYQKWFEELKKFQEKEADYMPPKQASD